MIAQEAQQQDALAKKSGVSAYAQFDRKKRLPKPNKTFLNNLVQQTDSHNYALILQENKRSRELLDGVEKRSRDHRDEGGRHKGGSSSSRDRDRDREYDGDRDRDRDRDHGRGDGRRRRERSEERKERRGESSGEDERPSTSRIVVHSERSLEKSPRDESSNLVPPPTADPHSSPSTLPAFPSTRRIKGRGATLSQPSSSRLDKYFEADYDPKLDMSNYDDTNLDHYVLAVMDKKRKHEGETESERKARKKEKKHRRKEEKEKKREMKKKKKKRKEEESSSSSSS
ncbi:hypothetical protein HDU98_010595 [Podochytrium sp. JEL0797]|nr:hypothetical protein HDU98_010595 [Podochytrium sp. JEL0797]